MQAPAGTEKRAARDLLSTHERFARLTDNGWADDVRCADDNNMDDYFASTSVTDYSSSSVVAENGGGGWDAADNDAW